MDATLNQSRWAAIFGQASRPRLLVQFVVPPLGGLLRLKPEPQTSTHSH